MGLYKSFATRLCSLILISFLSACNGGGGEQQAPQVPQVQLPAAISLTSVAGGLVQPVSITHAGDGTNRLFIVEQQGRVRIVRNGVLSPTPFLDITGQVTSGGEQGLLGLAFPPGFAARGSFYVNYTDTTGVGNTVIARFPLSADPDRADPSGESRLLTITQPFTNHNGGQLAFGPDGHLYIASGDGGSGGDPLGNGQNTASLLGKILRIDVLSGTAPYAIPAGNPFGNEVWSYGLRNPWRFSFDRLTGDIYVADVGQNEVEEVNFVAAGSGAGVNYGWNIMEGDQCFADPACSSAGLTLPVAQYLHVDGNCAVTGGYVYRGSNPALRGVYFYGDFCSGRIWGLVRNGTSWENRVLLDTTLSISAFGEDESGELYLVDHTGGELYRIE